MSDTRVSRRGFALPMVISLVVVVGIMSVVMLERQGVQRLVVQRQLDWYQEHHARLGLQEAIEVWLRALPTSFDLAANLPADGRFLELGLSDGTTATVTLQERQNAVLIDLAAVEDANMEAAAAIAEAVGQFYGEPGPPDGLRTVGPAALSTHSASPELLEIAAGAVLGDAGAGRLFAASLISDREDNGGRSTPTAVGTAAVQANLEPEDRALVNRMFTVRPTLFHAVVELRSSSYGPPLARYGGYFVVGTTRASSTSTPNRSAFLTWERLAIE